MEEGLAMQMTYGKGENQNTKHKYAVASPTRKRKKCKKLHKSRKKL